MKVSSVFTVLALVLSIITCSAQEESEHNGLTQLLDTMLSHQKIAADTGVQVGQESNFLTVKAASKKNSSINLLIASSVDENDAPLPLGWDDVGKLLNEPILSSHMGHDDFPVCQLWLGCLVAFLGLSFIGSGCGMLCRKKGCEEEDQESYLPTFERR
jgi:hypothetical protein